METYNNFTKATMIRRASERSIVAAAAYRAGEKLQDLQKGLSFDYSPRKKGILAKKILAPKGAPWWATNRQELWNQVELAEKRKDAQLARELQLQFPHELELETCCELLWDFCKENFADKGMVADAVIHAPGVGDDRNTHTHILLTTRELSEGLFGNKQREWNNTENLEKWKADWEKRCNEALEAIDSNIRFERRSIASQRAEKLAAMERTDDWYEKRQLEIEAARLNYIPRPHLSSDVFRAMVEGRAIAEGDKAIVAAWKAASVSKRKARAEADRLQRKLTEDLAIAPAIFSDPPFEHQIQSGDISFEDELADITWKKHTSKREILAGILVLLAEENPEAEFGALLMAAKNYEIVILEAPESWPRNGFKNLREISTATRRMGWRKYPFIADILRYDIDWSDELLDRHAAQAAASKELDIDVEDKTESPADQQASNKDTQLSNDGDATSTEGIEPPTPLSEQLASSFIDDNAIESTQDGELPSQTADDLDDKRVEDEVSLTPSDDDILANETDDPSANDAAPQDLVAQKPNEAADADLRAALKDNAWRSERIAQSRKHILKGQTAIDRVSNVWSSFKRGVGQQAPTLFLALRAATDRFLEAASNLLQAWRDFLARIRGDDFKTEEDEYIDASNALLKAQASAEQPSDLTVDELKGEQERIADILKLEDDGLILPIEKSTLKRSEQVSAYIASDEGRAVLEDHARIVKLEEDRKQKEIRDKRQVEQYQRLYAAAEKRANMVRPVLEKARRDTEIRAVVERHGFDMNQTNSRLLADISWHQVKDADDGSRLEIIEREIAVLEKQKTRTETSDRAEEPKEAPSNPDKAPTQSIRSDRGTTPEF